MVIVRGGRPRRQASTKKARDARAPARRGVPSARRHAMSLRGRMGARPPLRQRRRAGVRRDGGRCGTERRER
eukprot:scaffold33326_cov242-Isochrysis_galbana.AAC.5